MTVERITLDLYDSTGATLVGALGNIDGQAFRDELTQRGNGRFRIPLDDAEDLAVDSIVKFTWRGAIRFGCVINSESGDYALDSLNRRWLTFDNQPGLLSLYDQAVIQPEYGLTRRSGGTRWFGYMSKDGPWKVDADWVLPEYVLYTDEIYPRHHHPPELKPIPSASEPAWISATPGPDTTVAAGTKNWFRYAFTPADDYNLRVVYAMDNFGNAFFSGEQQGPADLGDQWGWKNAKSFDVAVNGGDEQLLAFDVENSTPFSSHTFNPLALICAVFILGDDGEPIPGPSGVLFTSNPVDYPDWEVCKVKPGWHKGYLIKKVIEEAQARSIPGANALTLTFTDSEDSTGDPWADDVDEYSCDVETTTVADFIVTLAEAGINVHVNAATMETDAFNRMGSDLYSSVEYTLGEGGSLMAYQVDVANARATNVTVHIENDTWTSVNDTAGLAAYGRREVGYAMGTASNTATARQFALAQLAESAKPQVQITAKTSTLQGPQFYDDHGLGDSVKLPGARLVGHLKGRCLAVAVGQEGDRVTVQPDFMKDES